MATKARTRLKGGAEATLGARQLEAALKAVVTTQSLLRIDSQRQRGSRSRQPLGVGLDSDWHLVIVLLVRLLACSITREGEGGGGT